MLPFWRKKLHKLIKNPGWSKSPPPTLGKNTIAETLACPVSVRHFPCPINTYVCVITASDMDYWGQIQQRAVR